MKNIVSKLKHGLKNTPTYVLFYGLTGTLGIPFVILGLIGKPATENCVNFIALWGIGVYIIMSIVTIWRKEVMAKLGNPPIRGKWAVVIGFVMLIFSISCLFLFVFTVIV